MPATHTCRVFEGKVVLTMKKKEKNEKEDYELEKTYEIKIDDLINLVDELVYQEHYLAQGVWEEGRHIDHKTKSVQYIHGGYWTDGEYDENET